MIKQIQAMLNFGTNAPNLLPHEKHAVRLLNIICFFILVVNIVEDISITRVIGFYLNIHDLITYVVLAVTVFLNYKNKVKAAKITFTAFALFTLLAFPFLMPKAIHVDAFFLVIIVMMFAIHNNIKVIIGITVFVCAWLIFWHISRHYEIIEPVTVISNEDLLHLQITYTLIIVCLLMIALFSFKKSSTDYQTELTQNIAEKDMLIKEVHHRVKNNLQVIVSMLSIQENNHKSKETQDVINDVKARVLSMLVIHNKLYATSDFQRLDLKEYLTELSSLLLTMYENKTISVELKTAIESHRASLQYLIPIGLIMTETISNSMKHAFNPRQKALIEISGKREGDFFVLRIKDNGKGIADTTPPEGSLGFLLIDILSKQIDAKLDRVNDNGLTTTITFPV